MFLKYTRKRKSKKNFSSGKCEIGRYSRSQIKMDSDFFEQIQNRSTPLKEVELTPCAVIS